MKRLFLYTTAVAIFAGVTFASLSAFAADMAQPENVQFARHCTLGNGGGSDECDITRELGPDRPRAVGVECYDRVSSQMKHGILLTWKQAERVAAQCPSPFE